MPQQDLEKELDRIAGPPTSATYGPSVSRRGFRRRDVFSELPDRVSTGDLESRLDRIAGPAVSESRQLTPAPARLTDPETGKSYAEHGIYGALTPSMYYANMVAQSPARFAKWATEKISGPLGTRAATSALGLSLAGPLG